MLLPHLLLKNCFVQKCVLHLAAFSPPPLQAEACESPGFLC